MNISTRASLVAIRLAAVIVMIASVATLWNVMLWLPWQIDCLLATTAAFAFAHRFERGGSQ